MSIDRFAAEVSAERRAWVSAGSRPWTCFSGSALAAERVQSARARRRRRCRATAKRVISLFMQGGPSQVDTFDPKPLLAKLHGQHPPDELRQRRFPERQVPRHR